MCANVRPKISDCLNIHSGFHQENKDPEMENICSECIARKRVLVEWHDTKVYTLGGTKIITFQKLFLKIFTKKIDQIIEQLRHSLFQVVKIKIVTVVCDIDISAYL